MSELFQHLRKVTEDLDRIGANYALVGGLAVSLQTEPRFTRDLDLAIAVESDAQAESLVRALAMQGYRIVAQSEQETAGRLATVRLAVDGNGGVVLDLLFASCGIEREIVDQAQRVEALPGWIAPVAMPHHLLAMKVLASDPRQRPQDAIDARALLQIMNEEQIEHTREALMLIERRGYHRKKALLKELERIIHD